MQKQLEERVAFLEAEVARLKDMIESGSSTGQPTLPWWEKIAGTFADDPMYDEAMRLGREYRDAQRLEDIEEEDKAKPVAPPVVAAPVVAAPEPSYHNSLHSKDTDSSEGLDVYS